EPRPTGVALVGDDPWLADFAPCLAAAGIEVLALTSDRTTPPTEGVAHVALSDGVHEVRRVIEEAPLSRAVVSLDRGAPLTLFEADLVERLGRRHVLTVPAEILGDGEADDGARLRPLRATAAAFHGHASRADLHRRHTAGATVEVVPAPLPPGAVLLATISPGGDVHLRRAPGTARPDDVLIALVGAD
ncbi:MAG TPA: hypothetical protein PKA98_20010, partial [Acidimicrobiales bacterium]|nr:hypothetical protein [Acidimicrobiales bacterium]